MASEPVASEFPEAWAILVRSPEGYFWSCISDVMPGGVTSKRSEIVKLIPAPEVGPLISAAEQHGRDAERERCKKRLLLIPTGGPTDPQDATDRDLGFWEGVNAAINAIDSGEQPGEGGGT